MDAAYSGMKKMRFLLASLAFLSLAPSASAGSETGNHGDPYFQEWQRAKLGLVNYLQYMGLSDLHWHTPEYVIDWFAHVEAKQSRLKDLTETLSNKTLDITKPNTRAREAGKPCLSEVGNKIVVDGPNCGTLTPAQMQLGLLSIVLKTMLKETGDQTIEEDNRLAQTVLAIIDGYGPKERDLSSLSITSLPLDTWRLRWYRAQRTMRYAVSRMQPKFIPKGTAKAVRDWLTEAQLAQLAQEINRSPLRFLELGQHNPEHTCAQTEHTREAPISISATDCGAVSKQQLWEMVVGDNVHHFNHGDDFSTQVGLAINAAYSRKWPALHLASRYVEWHYGGKNNFFMSFDNKIGRLLYAHLEYFSAESLPLLGSNADGFYTHGEVESDICYYDDRPNDGHFYGIHKKDIQYEGRLSFVASDNGWFQAHFNYEIFNIEHLPLVFCDTPKRNVSFTRWMRPYVWKRDDLVKKHQQKVSQALQTAIDGKDRVSVLEYIKTNLTDADYQLVLKFAIQQRDTELVMELVAIDKLVTDNGTIIQLVATRDQDFVLTLLREPKVYNKLNWYLDREGQLPLSYVLTYASEELALAIIKILAEHKYDFTRKLDYHAYRSFDAVQRTIFRQPYASAKIVDALLEHYPAERLHKKNLQNRTIMDYLAFRWILFQSACKPFIAKDPNSPASLDCQTGEANYLAIYNRLRALGLPRERNGFIYYKSQALDIDSVTGKIRAHNIDSDLRVSNYYGGYIGS